MTEVLVAAQLKALRELGILDSDDEGGKEAHGGEEDEEDEEDGEAAHERFLLALPPAPAPWTRPFSLPERLERWSLESSDRSAVEKRSAGSSYGASGYRNGSSASGVSIRSSSRPSEILQRRPRARRQADWVTLPRCIDPVTIKCFEKWKRYAAEHRLTANLRLLADACLKKRGINRWCGFLHWEKYEQERALRLNEWKVVQACKLWRAWTARRRRVQQLLGLDGRSFANLYRKVQVWRRWRRFSREKKIARLRVNTQRSRSSTRLLRSVWNELITHTFRSTQARQLVRRCFKHLARFRDEQLERHRLMEAYTIALEAAKLRRIVKHWRMFAYSLGYDRRCVRRVRFGIARKRFFALWRQVYRNRSRTAKFRRRVERQRLSEHFCAWRVVNQAITLANRITFTRDARQQRVLFEHWVREAALQQTFKAAKAAVEARRLSRAISSLMDLSALSRRRLCLIRELQAAHAQRVLKLVWTEGWLCFHKHQQRLRYLESRSIAARLLWALKLWERFHSSRSARRYQHESADAFLRAQSCRRRWRDWRAFVNLRREHNRALKTASSHYKYRLLRRGVAQWWDTVSQNSEVARRTLVIRQNQRFRLKARCFEILKIWARTKRRRVALVDRLKQAPAYQLSVCNPTRRAWRRWGAFVIQTKRDKQNCLHFRERLQRKVLQTWRRHAVIANKVRTIQFQRNDDVRVRALSSWKFRVDQRLKRAANNEAAMRFHKLKTSRRAFGCWVKVVTVYLRHVQVCREKLELQHKLQLQSNCFRVWMAEFRTRQHISHTFRRRQSCLQQLVMRVWHRYASKRFSLRRKLKYFRNIYGFYPRSSLVHRMWRMWRHIARQSSLARAFKQRQRRRSTQTYWLEWRSFIRYRRMFRAWRGIILSSGVSSASFKVRHCRKMCRRRLKISVLGRWKQLLSAKRHRAEHFSRLRLQIYLELRNRLTALQAAKVCCVRRWFGRWRFSENRASVRSTRRYQLQLLQKVLQGWWRLSIHARQEKVLHDAKRIIGAMSYYQEPIFEHTAVQPRNTEREPHKQTKEDAGLARRAARRLMTDPLRPTKYSALSGRTKKAPSVEGVKLRPAVPRECSAVYSAKEQKKLAPDLNVLTQDPINRKCSHVRSSRGNENVSLVNMVTLPPDQQVKPLHHASPSVKPLLHRAPAPYTTPDELSSNAPNQTKRVEYHNSQQSRGAVSSNRMSEHALATVDSSEVAHRSSRAATNSATAIDELPLYDEDCKPQERRQSPRHAAKPSRLGTSGTSHANHHIRSPSTRVKFKIEPPFSDSDTALAIYQADAAPHLSLESLVHLDVYGDLSHSATTTNSNFLTEATKRTASIASSAVTQPTTVKEADGHSRISPIVKVRQSARSPIRRVSVDLGPSEKCPLSEILGLRSVQPHSGGNTQAEPSKVTESSGASSAKRSLDDIIAYYAQQLQPGHGATSKTDAHSSTQLAWRVCFEMARDLRLLRNDFYICELECIFRIVRFMPMEGGPKQSPPQSPPESDLILVRNSDQLKLFLHEVISVHPAHVEATKTALIPSSNSGDLAFEPLSRVDQLQYPTLQWLIDVHLPLFVCEEAQAPTTCQGIFEGNYWSRHAMPRNMKRALDKFVPVIKKYTSILGQFFARGAGAFQHPSAGTIDPRDYRMTRRAFFALMKQARAFPQLFHRRELERAFGMSVMTYRDEDAVNFPEFVELLTRCSSSLQWGSNCHLDKDNVENGDLENGTEASTDADTTSVVKFLMLIFAMEGKGSVLRKRSKDLDVVIEFLNLQQQQSREHKMKRFKQLLVKQETARYVQRKERAKQATRSVAAKVLTLFSASKRAEVRSPKSPVASLPARTFDDLTHSWDSDYHATLLATGGAVAAADMDAAGIRVSAPVRAGAAGIDMVEASRLPLSPPTMKITGASRPRTERLEYDFATFEADEPIQDRVIVQTRCASASTDTRSPCETSIDDVNSTSTDPWATAHGTGGDPISDGKDREVIEQADGDGYNTIVEAAERLDLPSQLGTYDSPIHGRHSLSKNEFLDEILTSIGDVELILHQSSHRPERRRPSKPTLVDDTLHDGCSADQPSHVDHSRSELFAVPTAIKPPGTNLFIDQPSVPSRPTIPSFSFIASDLGGVAAQCDATCDDGNDVQVKDAMLDYLTDAARFSEGDRQGEASASTSALSDTFPFDLC